MFRLLGSARALWLRAGATGWVLGGWGWGVGSFPVAGFVAGVLVVLFAHVDVAEVDLAGVVREPVLSVAFLSCSGLFGILL